MLLGAVAAVGLPVGAAAGKSAHRHSQKGCAAANRIVLQDRWVQIVRRRVFTRSAGAYQTDLFACQRRTRRALPLADPQFPAIFISRRSVRLAGKFAAGYALLDSGSEGWYVIRIVDLRSAHPRYLLDQRSTITMQQPFGAPVTDLALSDTGRAAWIVRPFAVSPSPPLEVRASDVHGVVHLLDSGTAIRPGSLRLRGLMVTWRDGAQVLSSTLP